MLLWLMSKTNKSHIFLVLRDLSLRFIDNQKIN